MATAPTPQPEPVTIPWAYLGGYLLFFVGLFFTFIGGWEYSGGHTGVPSADKLVPLTLVFIGLATFVGGSFIMARAEQVRSNQMAFLMVCLIMTPLPSLVALGVHFVGNYMRRTASAPVQVILVAAGVFLLALAANWGWETHDALRRDFRAFSWALLANLGLVAILLACLPMFERQKAAACVNDEADKAV